jgi:hypothetical protein
MSRTEKMVITLSPDEKARVTAHATSQILLPTVLARKILLEAVAAYEATLHQADASPKKKEKSVDAIPIGKRTFDQLSDRGKRVAIRLVWCERYNGYMPGTDIGEAALAEARKWLPPGDTEPPRDQADVPHFWEVE